MAKKQENKKRDISGLISGIILIIAGFWIFSMTFFYASEKSFVDYLGLIGSRPVILFYLLIPIILVISGIEVILKKRWAKYLGIFLCALPTIIWFIPQLIYSIIGNFYGSFMIIFSLIEILIVSIPIFLLTRSLIKTKNK